MTETKITRGALGDQPITGRESGDDGPTTHPFAPRLWSNCYDLR